MYVYLYEVHMHIYVDVCVHMQACVLTLYIADFLLSCFWVAVFDFHLMHNNQVTLKKVIIY